MIKHVGYVLHENSDGFEGFNIVEVFLIESRTRVVPKRFRVLVNLTKFRTSDPCECLTGRSADYNINRLIGLSKIQLCSQRIGTGFRDVNGLGVGRLAGMEVVSMRTCRVGIELHSAHNTEASGVKAQGQTAATSKEIKYTDGLA